MLDGPLTVTQVAEDLERLGVAPGDVVMVHASLRAVGPVEGGAAGVVAALDRAVGEPGTLLMMVSARDDWAWVNERPETDREALLADAEPFDPMTTPADPEVGVLAEIFRQSPGTLVSNHPEGRFAARGRQAAEFVADVPWDDYYGPGSPLEHLVRSGGKVLRLGAGVDTVTLIHYAEYLAEVPDKRRVRRHRLVISPEGPVVRPVECLDDGDGIVDHPGPDYFGVILGDYLGSRPVPCGTVGGAWSELIDAADLAPFAADWMTTHLRVS
jgi:aminoglycoside N3'-acetyltransferase